ncbi:MULTISPECIES: hypothetical protein [unclassified Chryseobacterium]|uniref:hypothetical protein n=1 Tax=unclassified Chryseobacterium TaxID=2593645 RepID=UPI00301AE56F
METAYSNNPISEKLKTYSLVCIYLVVNSLFIIKYSEQYNIPLLAGYLALFFGLGFFYLKFHFKEFFYKTAFFLGIFFFFLISIYLNYKVDGNTLNVDRWSAMEVGIKAVFSGQYPYNIPDHMGRESSNLPVLIVFGMPFYLLFGSVGYLQSFSFLLFAYLVFKIFNNYRQRLAVLVLLFLSPSYLWEIYVKSDLFSNFIIIAGFVYLIGEKFIKEKKINSAVVSVLSALVLLTRLSAVIPLTVLIFKKFLDFSIQQKLRFAAVFLVTMAAVCYIFFHNAPDFDVFLKHNPFVIQGGKQPLILSISYIVSGCILSFRVKSFYETLFWSGILLFICVFVPFIMFFAEYGYENMLVNSYFDISFFNMSMPFVMTALILSIFKNNIKV